MKILRYLSLVLLMTCHAAASANTMASQPLIDVLKEFEQEYKVFFSFKTKDIKGINVRFEFNEQEVLETAINRVLSNTGLRYKYLGLNFYIIHKENKDYKKRLKKINRKIEQIKRLGSNDGLVISNGKNLYDQLVDGMTNINGQVTNEYGHPLIGATILITGSQTGTITDYFGRYYLEGISPTDTLEVSYTGYTSQRKSIADQKQIDVKLKDGLMLNSVTVFGSRAAPRSKFDSPVPIDYIAIDALQNSGRHSLDEQLAHSVPSFVSAQHPVSDASSHFNPADLRGLLPSRTLVLVNGKRKNSSAILYSYVTASRGEVGVDLKSISPDAINSVEILRDGAAAQYGSDAVAGVINLTLKDKIRPFINAGYGSTSQLDGMQFNASSGFSFDLMEEGFVTVTMSYNEQKRTQRSGVITSAIAEANHWSQTDYTLDDFQSYLERNPRAGFQVGIPDMQAINVSLNSAYTLNDLNGVKLYLFGTYMNRTGSSPQFARTPYWVSGFESIYPGHDYFLPEMSPKIQDQSITAGITHNLKGWDIDLSSSFGRNRIDYYINNSFNQSLGKNSPKNFYNGAHSFTHVVNNIDLKKSFDLERVDGVTIAIGAEQRIESFNAFAGEFASYGDGTPDLLDRIGSESFSGLTPEDAVGGGRSNLGVYTELSSDINTKVQLGGAIRFERYSDFDDNISWKLNLLYKAISQKLNIRSSISNGFRAPALHQKYFTSTTTTLTPDGIVQNRILNNLDPVLRLLEVPQLMPETSLNLGAGFTYKLSDKIGFSVDLYQIRVDDRIVLSGQISKIPNEESPVNELLSNINKGSTGFFLNAVNSTTEGIDLVFTLNHIALGRGSFKGSIAANFNNTTVDEVNLPNFIESNGLSDNVFSREDISRLESWRPRQKIILSNSYTLGKFTNSLNLNYFGSVTYRHPTNPTDDATYGGKFLTDWNCSYYFNDKLKWTIGINNIFNVYPDTFQKAYGGEPEDRNIDFVGRFKYPWQTMQFGIDGMRAFTKMSINF